MLQVKELSAELSYSRHEVVQRLSSGMQLNVSCMTLHARLPCNVFVLRIVCSRRSSARPLLPEKTVFACDREEQDCRDWMHFWDSIMAGPRTLQFIKGIRCGQRQRSSMSLLV